MGSKHALPGISLAAALLMAGPASAHVAATPDAPESHRPLAAVCERPVAGRPAPAPESTLTDTDRALSLLQSAHEQLARETGAHWRRRFGQVDQQLVGIDRDLEAGPIRSKPPA